MHLGFSAKDFGIPSESDILLEKKCLFFLSGSEVAELKVELIPTPLSRQVSDRYDCWAAGYATLTEWSFTHFTTAQLVFPAYRVLSSFYMLLQG